MTQQTRSFKRPVVGASVDVYLARGLLYDYVKSISCAIQQQCGFETTPRSGYLGNKLHATCERSSGTALTTSPVFVLELIDDQTEVVVQCGAVRHDDSCAEEWTVERFVWTRDWLTNLSALLTRATPAIISDVLAVLETAGETHNEGDATLGAGADSPKVQYQVRREPDVTGA